MSLQQASSSPARLRSVSPVAEEFRNDFQSALRCRPRILSPKHFYDTIGSALFDQICDVEEYFPCRTEKALLEQHGAAIAQLAGRRCRVVEYGSGSSDKTRLLLDHLEDPVSYVPIDISREFLLQSAKALGESYPLLEVQPVAADYTADHSLPVPRRHYGRTLFFFPGSTVGNFLPTEALGFLRHVAGEAQPGDGFLIGIGLQTDREVLERAYNDSAGLTAAFNLNVLRRARDELGARIDLDAFTHQAVYDTRHARIEMRLISQWDQVVELDGERFPFEAGEVIVTEYSHKFTDAGFMDLASQAGFRPKRFWSDSNQRFSIHYLTR